MELRAHPALHDVELRVFSPRAPSVCHSTYHVMRSFWGGGGERSCRQNNSRNQQQQQSQPKRFAVAVVVVTLGLSLYVLSIEISVYTSMKTPEESMRYQKKETLPEAQYLMGFSSHL